MPSGSLLVISPRSAVRDVLAGAPSLAHLRIISVSPGPSLADVVHQEHPCIAVLDGIQDRLEAARQEIIALKAARPEIQVIVLSERSSERDALIIEEGVFFYLTAPPGRELIRVVEAAILRCRPLSTAPTRAASPSQATHS